jgi:hypothetical protein
MPHFDEAYHSWAWTPRLVQEKEKHDSLLLNPIGSLEPEAAIAHFNILRNGVEYSWLWLFSDAREAVALRLFPNFLPPEDDMGTLIKATLPPDRAGQPQNCYLQIVPLQWLLTWDLLGNDIQEVWFGFDFRKFKLDRNLRSCTNLILGAEELVGELQRRGTI